MVDYLEQTFSPRDAAVTYIHNSYKEHDEQSATNLMGASYNRFYGRSLSFPLGL